MQPRPLVTSITAILSVVLAAGCGADVADTTVEVGHDVKPTSIGAETQPDEVVVVEHLPIDWDSPVVGGIEVTRETAQEVSGAAFEVETPTLPRGTLLKIQATDPERYPEEMRGYGVLYDVADDQGAEFRLLIEETRVTSGEEELIRELANNGPGFELDIIDGVEVVFIHPTDERAGAVLILDGVKYNIHGPALPRDIVRDVVTAITSRE